MSGGLDPSIEIQYEQLITAWLFFTKMILYQLVPKNLLSIFSFYLSFSVLSQYCMLTMMINLNT